MADIQRLEYHLQNVHFFAEVGPISRYRAVRRSALGACNRLFRKVPGERARDYILGIKRQIQDVEYSAE